MYIDLSCIPVFFPIYFEKLECNRECRIVFIQPCMLLYKKLVCGVVSVFFSNCLDNKLSSFSCNNKELLYFYGIFVSPYINFVIIPSSSVTFYVLIVFFIRFVSTGGISFHSMLWLYFHIVSIFCARHFWYVFVGYSIPLFLLLNAGCIFDVVDGISKSKIICIYV